MAGSVYIMGTAADPARLAVALDLLLRLPTDGEKTAYYKPLISAEEDTSGRTAVSAAIRFFAPHVVIRHYHAMGHEAAAIPRNKLIDLIVAKYHKLMRSHDWVVVQGTDYLPEPAAFEADLNLEIAQHTGAPVFLVLKGSGRLPAAVAIEARDIAERLTAKKMVLAGVLVNGAFGWQAAYNDLLRQQLGDHIPVTALPEISIPDLAAGASIYSTESKNINCIIHKALAKLATGIDVRTLKDRLQQAVPAPTGSVFRSWLLERARRQQARIVLPEGEDPRILRAAARFIDLHLGELVLLGDPEKIAQRLKQEQIVLSTENITIINPANNPDAPQYADMLYHLRKAKGIMPGEAQELVLDPSYLGCLIVKSNKADAMVSGAVYTTRQTVRPALQLIRGKSGKPLVSSVFFMCLPWQVMIFADCAVNPEPTAQQLAEIALSTAETSRKFDIEPRVAMISYSTAESSTGSTVQKVREATEIVKTKAPELLIEGPMQYDAAVDPVTAHAKWPGSAVAGRATIFIFPDLNTGNTVYKAVQQATGAIAIGPVLQELNKPVNDLSRGGTADDIFYTLLATLIQCQHSTSKTKRYSYEAAK